MFTVFIGVSGLRVLNDDDDDKFALTDWTSRWKCEHTQRRSKQNCDRQQGRPGNVNNPAGSGTRRLHRQLRRAGSQRQKQLPAAGRAVIADEVSRGISDRAAEDNVDHQFIASS